MLSKPFFVLAWPEPPSITPMLSWVLVGDGCSFAGCRGWERDALPAASAALASAAFEPGERGWGAAASWAQGSCWHSLGMDVSGPCRGAGSSPAPWMVGRLARPCGLIHTGFHTLQSKRGEKTCPCFPLGSQPQIQPKAQPQTQRSRAGTARTLSTHPAPCPVADKPYTSQHPPAPRIRPAPASAPGHSSASGQGPSALD